MKLRVLVLTHQSVEQPGRVKGLWKTERHVISAIKRLKHETRLLGNVEEVAAIRTILFEWKPHITFNLMEEFRGEGIYVPYVLGYLQLMRQPFTGCNPTGLQLADDKVLAKKLLRYHRIPAPDGVEDRIAKLCKRVYRILGLSGYARMDFRLTDDGKIFLLEPNPNPDLARDEDFAESAKAVGIEYDKLIGRVLRLGLQAGLSGSGERGEGSGT